MQMLSACPRCGAAIFYPSAWWSILPPPPSYTCGCFAAERLYITATTTSLEVVTVPADRRSGGGK